MSNPAQVTVTFPGYVAIYPPGVEYDELLIKNVTTGTVFRLWIGGDDNVCRPMWRPIEPEEQAVVSGTPKMVNQTSGSRFELYLEGPDSAAQLKWKKVP